MKVPIQHCSCASPMACRAFQLSVRSMPSAATTSCCRPAAAPANPAANSIRCARSATTGSIPSTWINAQPWFDGRLGTSGPSYLGYAQWAISDSLAQKIRHGHQGLERRVPHHRLSRRRLSARPVAGLDAGHRGHTAQPAAAHVPDELGRHRTAHPRRLDEAPADRCRPPRRRPSTPPSGRTGSAIRSATRPSGNRSTTPIASARAPRRPPSSPAGTTS